MQLNSIKSKLGSTKAKRRVGRGNSSGSGTYCGRGCKGQGQRKSSNVRPGFEGGQTPLIMRLPKLKGFKNPNKVEFQIINLSDINRYDDGEEVNVLTLLEKKIICRKNNPVKLLGNGKLTKKLNVKVHKVSVAAKKKVEEAGGKVL